MKPARFSYHRAQNESHAIELLTDLGDGARILAGGQSLIPMMNFRLARPTALIDISGIGELAGIKAHDGGVEIGALTTHGRLEHFAAFPGALAVVAETARFIGHPAIRTRGTIGGSLAHSDPAAEWTVLMMALGAVMVVAGPTQVREEPVETFLKGLFTTSLAPDELLVGIRIPRARSCAGFAEYARRHGDFAIVMAAVAFDLDGDQAIGPRIVLGGVDAGPVRANQAELALQGRRPTADALVEIGDVAAGEVDPFSDNQATSEYRRRLVRTLVARACVTAIGRSIDPPGRS